MPGRKNAGRAIAWPAIFLPVRGPMEMRPLVRADLITGVILLVFGVAVVAESYGMPRLEERNINPWTAPGIVPGMLGLVITLLGAALAFRSAMAGGFHTQSRKTLEEAAESRVSFARLALCAALCVIYAVLLVGRVPFWLATGLFVFVFIVAFEWQETGSNAGRLRMLAVAIVIAAATAIVVSFVFEYLFLVRLP
jgi:putative tricarboxylic transport membrane protein